MLSSTDIEILKRKLPTDWVSRVMLKVSYGATRIREALRDPEKYVKDPYKYEKDAEIINAAIEVASEFQIQIQESMSLQKQNIKQLS